MARRTIFAQKEIDLVSEQINISVHDLYNSFLVNGNRIGIFDSSNNNGTAAIVSSAATFAGSTLQKMDWGYIPGVSPTWFRIDGNNNIELDAGFYLFSPMFSVNNVEDIDINVQFAFTTPPTPIYNPTYSEYGIRHLPGVDMRGKVFGFSSSQPFTVELKMQAYPIGGVGLVGYNAQSVIGVGKIY